MQYETHTGARATVRTLRVQCSSLSLATQLAQSMTCRLQAVSFAQALRKQGLWCSSLGVCSKTGLPSLLNARLAIPATSRTESVVAARCTLPCLTRALKKAPRQLMRETPIAILPIWSFSRLVTTSSQTWIDVRGQGTTCWTKEAVRVRWLGAF